jgi:DNA-binding transcriptional MerR regulator
MMLQPHPAPLLRIGEVADRSTVPVKTIRYYESLGLIQAVKRTPGGYRLFDAEVLARLAFIKRAQPLGLSLQEIHEILAIHDQGELPCEQVRQQFQKKVHQIEAQIEQLELLKAQLQSLLRDQHPVHQGTICPIIEAD